VTTSGWGTQRHHLRGRHETGIDAKEQLEAGVERRAREGELVVHGYRRGGSGEAIRVQHDLDAGRPGDAPTVGQHSPRELMDD
jgi:hypothetical protein